MKLEDLVNEAGWKGGVKPTVQKSSNKVWVVAEPMGEHTPPHEILDTVKVFGSKKAFANYVRDVLEQHFDEGDWSDVTEETIDDIDFEERTGNANFHEMFTWSTETELL